MVRVDGFEVYGRQVGDAYQRDVLVYNIHCIWQRDKDDQTIDLNHHVYNTSHQTNEKWWVWVYEALVVVDGVFHHH